MKHANFKPDLSEWGIEALEEIEETISSGLKKALEQILHHAFLDDETYLYFPVEWSKEPGSEWPGTDGLGGGGSS